MQEDQMRITQHLIPILPELIAKYELNNDITCNLLSIVDNLKVGMYITLRKEDVRIVSMNFIACFYS